MISGGQRTGPGLSSGLSRGLAGAAPERKPRTFVVEKSSRESSPITILLSGTSGVGKTTAALALAFGLAYREGEAPEQTWQHILVVDTDRRRAAKKTNQVVRLGDGDFVIGVFQYIAFDGPRTAQDWKDLAARLRALCAQEGPDDVRVVVIESLSDLWEEVRELQSEMGGTAQDWLPAGQFLNAVINDLVTLPAHLVGTGRMKSKIAIETDEDSGEAGGKKKTRVRKLGEKCELRDSIEYAFDVHLEISRAHRASANIGKDQTDIFENRGEVELTPTVGKMLERWSATGDLAIGSPAWCRREVNRLDKAATLEDFNREFAMVVSLSNGRRSPDAEMILGAGSARVRAKFTTPAQPGQKR